MAKGLSKSRYTLFCKCEKAFWLNVFDPDKASPIDDAQKARFEQGNVVGDLAMGLFGPYEEVTTLTPDGKLDLGTMVAKTKDEMQKGTANICEASFAFDGNYCAVDILRKTPRGWAIYEVKSTSYPEFNGSPTQLEKYAPDIAYQKWLLEQCGVVVTDVYLVCLNSDYVRRGALDLKKLFVVVDFDEFIAGEYLLVPGRVARAKEVLQLTSEPEKELGRQCSKPYECAFWAYCKKQKRLPEPSVFDVYGGSTKSKKDGRFFIDKKLEHYYAGRVSFDDLKNQKLGHVQRLHIEGKEFLDKEGIRAFLDTLSYPMYFLDFETMMYAIPQFDGTRPYQQVTFQYSLHIKRSESEPYEHKEFLAQSDGSNPLPAVAKRLCEDIPKDVCVLAYNKTFECSRIKEMADIFPNLKDHLLNIRDNIQDLLDPFQAGYCYKPAMGGSFSIKSVLPALFPEDPQLDYHNLEGSVHNGGEAMDIFPRIKDMSPADADAARKSLLEYCWLDTWAMVKVWEKLTELTK